MRSFAGTFVAAVVLLPSRVASTEFKARDEVLVVANTVRVVAVRQCRMYLEVDCTKQTHS